MAPARERSSQLIVAGFVITALGALGNFVNLSSKGALSQSSRYDVELVCATLASCVTLGGWWFLSQLRAGDERQRVIVRRGFYLFALELFLGSVGTAAFTITLRLGNVHLRYFLVAWAPAVGGAVAAVGFFLGAWRLGPAGRVASDLQADDGDAAAH